ncbi:hypothetical protein AgCh_029329 [Apium graveolens]
MQRIIRFIFGLGLASMVQAANFINQSRGELIAAGMVVVEGEEVDGEEVDAEEGTRIEKAHLYDNNFQDNDKYDEDQDAENYSLH